LTQIFEDKEIAGIFFKSHDDFLEITKELQEYEDEYEDI